MVFDGLEGYSGRFFAPLSLRRRAKPAPAE